MCAGRVGGGNGSSIKPGEMQSGEAEMGGNGRNGRSGSGGVKRFLGQRLTFSRTITINNWRGDFTFALMGEGGWKKGRPRVKKYKYRTPSSNFKGVGHAWLVGGLEDSLSPMWVWVWVGWGGRERERTVGASGRKVWGMDDWDEDLGWKPMGM